MKKSPVFGCNLLPLMGSIKCLFIWVPLLMFSICKHTATVIQKLLFHCLQTLQISGIYSIAVISLFFDFNVCALCVAVCILGMCSISADCSLATLRSTTSLCSCITSSCMESPTSSLKEVRPVCVHAWSACWELKRPHRIEIAVFFYNGILLPSFRTLILVQSSG